MTSLTSVWTTIVLAMSSQCHSCATLFPLSRLLAPVFPWITTSVCIPSLPHCTQSPPQYVYIHCLSIYTHYLCMYSLLQYTQLPPRYVLTASVYTLTTSVPTAFSMHNHHLSMYSLPQYIHSLPLYVLTASVCTIATSVCTHCLSIYTHYLCIYSLLQCAQLPPQ